MTSQAALIRRISLFALLSFFLTIRGLCQDSGFTREIRFAQYLQDKDLFREAQFVIGRIDTSLLTATQKDTIHYFSGWAAYNAKQLDTAVSKLLQVSSSYSLYRKSRFFAAYCLAYQNRQQAANDVVTGLQLTDSTELEMRRFQLAGMALLRRDYTAFDRYQRGFTYSSYVMEKEEKNMDVYLKGLRSYKTKSPLLAGVYSAVLPGAGKFYAGKKRQGIAAFLPIVSLGAVAYEAYRKAGAGSARFIAFGSLFSVFYIGNIWGSVMTVKIKKKEFYRTYDNQILFDMHIPLRNLYN